MAPCRPRWHPARDDLPGFPDGQAVLEGDAADIEAFLARTLAIVPAGSESLLLDLDGEIEALLAA